MAGDGESGLSKALELDRAARDLEDERGAGSENPAVAEPDLFGSDRSVFGTVRSPVSGKAVATGPGRPRGSRNRSTAELVKLISATGRHPLLAMAEIVAMPIDHIASTLGCKLIEAAEYHRKVMSDLAPYVAQKQPTAVQVAGANAGMLVINLGQPIGVESGQGLDMKLIDADPQDQQNQELSDGEDDASHDAPSHDEGK